MLTNDISNNAMTLGQSIIDLVFDEGQEGNVTPAEAITVVLMSAAVLATTFGMANGDFVAAAAQAIKVTKEANAEGKAA